MQRVAQPDHLAGHLKRESVFYVGEYPFSIRWILLVIPLVDEYVKIARPRKRWSEPVGSLGPVGDLFSASEQAAELVHPLRRIADAIRALPAV